MRHNDVVVLLTLFAAAACSDPPALTEPGPPVAFAINPASSGATILRGETGFQIAIYDAEKQLIAFHNFRNAFPACGQQVTQVSLAEFLEVVNGRDPTLSSGHYLTDDSFITVWHSTDGNFLAVRCTTPIAKGTGRFMYADNDVTPFAGDHGRANTWMYKGEGILTGSDGTLYHYSGVSRFVIQVDGVGGDDVINRSINLSPLGN